ncbi:MAG: N-acetylneuraminate synthase family protein [Candidatus Omnitrophica bacterium]|nr:N-acetylneuraminate synthase family protein [Candidatus Omnitrophota bacterium]
MEIIAEIGQNHNGDMDLAVRMIQSAKANGADVVKFQLFSARRLFIKEGNPWYDYNLKTELSKDQLFMLFEECKKNDIEFMASPFDLERVAWLEDINVKRYKLASRSIYDNVLIAALCRTAKPLIVSLGLWKGQNFPEISTEKIDFLYCISKYPASLEDIKLSSVDFKKFSGFSDHTIGISAAVAAFARGARIIEKHFTLDKNMYGPDHSGSMDPEDLSALNEFRNEIKLCI